MTAPSPARCDRGSPATAAPAYLRHARLRPLASTAVYSATLTDPGFDHTVLSEFRTRLVRGSAELLLLDVLLERLKSEGLVKARGRQRTDSTHVLAAVRVLNRLERVGETLRAALNELAAVAPEWLRDVALPAWYERYGRRVENYRLPKTESLQKRGLLPDEHLVDREAVRFGHLGPTHRLRLGIATQPD